MLLHGRYAEESDESSNESFEHFEQARGARKKEKKPKQPGAHPSTKPIKASNHKRISDVIAGHDDHGDETYDGRNMAIQNMGVHAVLMDTERIRRAPTTSTVRIGRSIVTAQNQTGRCWKFAGLNLVRIKLAEKLKRPNMELSTSFLFFYDKIERSRFFLKRMFEFRARGQGLYLSPSNTMRPPASKVVHRDPQVDYWMRSPLQGDGGHWDFFVNLATKYGVMPKEAFPDTTNASNSAAMNQILERVLRHAARCIMEGKNWKNWEAAARDVVEGTIEPILVELIGRPPTEFVLEWSQDDPENKMAATRVLRDKPMKPLELLQLSGLDLRNGFVALGNDPRWPLGVKIQMDEATNMIGGSMPKMLNVSVDDMQMATMYSICAVGGVKENTPVWFGCDVMKQASIKNGIMDAKLIRYQDLIGDESGCPPMTRLDMIQYREGAATHAMLFTGCHMNASGKIDYWLVENSWGKKPSDSGPGMEGYLRMHPNWWEHHMWEVIVPKEAAAAVVATKYREAGKTVVKVAENDPLFLKRM